MNIVMWILAGGALGWAGFRLLGINEQRGTIGSLINMIENRFGI